MGASNLAEVIPPQEEFTITGYNRDKTPVNFVKEKYFIEALKAYVDLLKFGARLAELGHADPKAAAPVFCQNPADSIANVRKRFSALTMTAIKKHEVWKNPNVKLIQYERIASTDAVNSNPNDIANFGRYRAGGMLSAYLDPAFFPADKMIHIGKNDREIIFDDVAKSLIDNNFYSYSAYSTDQSSERIDAQERIKNLFMNNFDIYVIPVPNGGELDPLKELTVFNTKFNNKFCFAAGFNRIRFSFCYPVCSKQEKEPFRAYALNRTAINLAKSKDSGLMERILGEHFPQVPLAQVKSSVTKLKLINGVGCLDYTSVDFFWNILKNFVQEPREFLTKDFPDAKPSMITNYMYLDSLINKQYFPQLGENFFIFAQKQKIEGQEKPFVEINRFALNVASEFTLSANTVRNAEQFMKAHNTFNSFINGLTNA